MFLFTFLVDFMEDTDQNNSEYRHFLRSESHSHVVNVHEKAMVNNVNTNFGIK